MSAKSLPVHYQNMADRGFRWRSLREAHCHQVILWQHPETSEFRLTIRFEGRVVEFQPVGDGTMTIAKAEPKPRSAFEDLSFALEHGVTRTEPVWIDEVEEESLQVTAIMKIDNSDISEKIERVYGE